MASPRRVLRRRVTDLICIRNSHLGCCVERTLEGRRRNWYKGHFRASVARQTTREEGREGVCWGVEMRGVGDYLEEGPGCGRQSEMAPGF